MDGKVLWSGGELENLVGNARKQDFHPPQHDHLAPHYTPRSPSTATSTR